ncbi:hypothetical protein IAE16_07035 [Hydrogenobacter sp. T-2]|uniref:hypothetical protein n=1 Tax=Pampinifervens diazotrophicum TaxID=1632018 RepID=UPI002B258C6F|nr:hypothetical protein [Hydrogenobacter sp. T-2]WPM31572.1 hypothetical protein IAE16_07035 [Hydrogenobacter sp. T-2]
MKYLILASLLLMFNLLYSSYSLNVARDYAKKVSELKREKERSLTLKAEIEKHINYKTVKSYAESSGLSPIDWSRIKVVKSSTGE